MKVVISFKYVVESNYNLKVEVSPINLVLLHGSWRKSWHHPDNDMNFTLHSHNYVNVYFMFFFILIVVLQK